MTHVCALSLLLTPQLQGDTLVHKSGAGVHQSTNTKRFEQKHE